MKRTVVAAAAVVAASALALWAFAQDAPKPEPTRIELAECGTYKDSDCLYVMTKDVVAKGTGFRFEGKNYVVDLGGHTLTFNTEPWKDPNEKEYWLNKVVFGVMLRGENGELRNGTILQGAGHDVDARCIFAGVKKGRIHDTTTVITGGDRGKNIFSQWAGSDIEVDHNYLVNGASAENGWYAALTLFEVGDGWDVHHNTIVGGHQGVLVSGLKPKEGVHVHHNYISNKRTLSQKVPEGIYIRAGGMEIDHNEIVTVDGRGLEPTGKDNYWHDNIVDVRYMSQAAGGFYPENRCYGYWERDCSGNRIVNNLFFVNNEVVGDDTSNTVGVVITTSNATLRAKNTTITGNRFVIRHNDKARPAWGFELTRVEGDGIVIKDNWVWAATSGVNVDEASKGAVIEGNTFVKSGDAWQLATPADGEGVKNCTFKDNKVVAPPADKVAPAAPTGLVITRRFNGYELHWDANKEDDVLGYYVWRDGKRVEDRLKCGRFYVDVAADPKGTYSYEISASDLSGNEGPKSAPVSTATAK